MLIGYQPELRPGINMIPCSLLRSNLSIIRWTICIFHYSDVWLVLSEILRTQGDDSEKLSKINDQLPPD